MKLINGYCEDCETYYNQADLKELHGCGCEACYDDFKNSYCPECEAQAERAQEAMLSDFYGGSEPFTTREKQAAEYRLK